MIERSLYRCAEPQAALDNIIFDPFESPFRPVKTKKSSRQSAARQINDSNSENEAYNWPLNLKQASAELEVKMINAALEHSRHNQKKAAELLQVSYHQLRGYLKKYKLLDSLKHD